MPLAEKICLSAAFLFFMILLIVGEVGGALVLGTGAMLGIWSS
ncbi:hypothetical protein [Marinobacter apostichopi]|nr:hypothetical protein [Marinobacter sp. LA51]